MRAPSRCGCALLLLALGCGKETRTPPASPGGACGAPATCDPDLAGGGVSAGGASGGDSSAVGGTSSAGAASAGAAGVAGDGGGPPLGSCSEADAAAPSRWAVWPMPHPRGSALPNPASYDTTLPGVALDRVTGLMWQREVPVASSFAEAQAGCTELELAGHCDWRLPTRIELVSLVDFTRAASALDAVFPAVSGEFWSTSTLGNNRWRVGADGATRVSSESMAPSAVPRCVRVETPHTLPAPQYETGGQAPNDWVKDGGTGLTWQRRPGTSTFSFAEAEAHCAAWGEGGFRVPSMKELQTLLDESKSVAPLIDTEAFPDFPTTLTVTFWTSSVSAKTPGHAWFLRGASTLDVAVDAGVDAKFYVRCVR